MKSFFGKYFHETQIPCITNPRTDLRTYILTFPDGESRLKLMTRPEVEGDLLIHSGSMLRYAWKPLCCIASLPYDAYYFPSFCS